MEQPAVAENILQQASPATERGLFALVKLFPRHPDFWFELTLFVNCDLYVLNNCSFFFLVLRGWTQSFLPTVSCGSCPGLREYFFIKRVSFDFERIQILEVSELNAKITNNFPKFLLSRPQTTDMLGCQKRSELGKGNSLNG